MASDAAALLDPKPVICHASDGCVLAHWRAILIGIWATQSSLELVAEQEKIVKLIAAESPKQSSIHLVIKRAPLPSADVRAAYESLTRRYADRFACSALLIQGDGFWASAVRAFLTGIQLFAQTRIRAFNDLEALVTWVAEVHGAETGAQLAPDELRAALEWLLAQPSVREYRTRS